MKRYYSYTAKKAVTVQSIQTVEELEFPPDFHYEDETHSFWELIYVDRGTVLCDLLGELEIIGRNEVFFIKPGTHHSYLGGNTSTARVIIICFQASAPMLRLLEGKTLLSDAQRELLRAVMFEAQNTFRFPFRSKLTLLDNPIFGGTQLLGNYLETFLISLVREKLQQTGSVQFFMSSAEMQNQIVRDTMDILKANIYSTVDLNGIAAAMHYSKTHLNTLFKAQIGATIYAYFISMKVNEAKRLLRENKLSMSEVAEKLAFYDLNHFVKVFRKHTGMTPAQYKKETAQ